MIQEQTQSTRTTHINHEQVHIYDNNITWHKHITVTCNDDEQQYIAGYIVCHRLSYVNADINNTQHA